MSEARPGNSGRADYPRMLYQADGRMIIAHSPEEHETLFHQGWDTVPASVARPVSSFGTLGATSDPIVEALRQVIREELRAILNEEFNKRNIGRRNF